MRARALLTMLLAGVALAAPAAVQGAQPLNPAEVCPGCYLVTDTVDGYHCGRDAGGAITCSPVIGGPPGSRGVPVGYKVAERDRLGEAIPVQWWSDNLLDVLSDINPAIVDTASIPPVLDRRDGKLQRQPVIDFDRPSAPGTFAEPGVINIVRELAAQGDPLAPNQVEALRRKVAERGAWVPGTLYVTVILVPAGDKWRVDRWLYNFAPNLKLVLRELPAPECPPGSPGTWPDCDPSSCPEGKVWVPAVGTCATPASPTSFCPEGTTGTPPDCRPIGGGFGKSDVKVRIRGFY